MSHARSKALEVANAFLAAQANLDLDAAVPLASSAYFVVSPGGKRTELGPLFERLTTGYARLEKHIQTQDVTAIEGGHVVYNSGVMVGCRGDGTEFEGVRFMTRPSTISSRSMNRTPSNSVPSPRQPTITPEL